MTYQAPEGWRVQARGPQHAAPFCGSTPLRRHARRALRLFVAAGAWLSGLCLIIGSVALVAEAAAPASAQHVRAEAGNYRVPASPAGRPAGNPGRAAPPGGGARTVLRSFTGTGNLTTAQFRVAPHSRWELQWSYTCATRVPRGHLIIREDSTANGGLSVDAAGAAGAGTTWTYSDASAHYLVVITNCRWTARVIGHR
jgi:hypothetical protein